jgi:hypothetical protein
MSRKADREGRYAYSGRLDEALVLAAAVHQIQVRKGTAVPYIIHLPRSLIRSARLAEDVVVGARRAQTRNAKSVPTAASDGLPA